MTTPANENTYDQAGDSAICKGAPQASRANPPSFASAQAAAKGRCSDVLHDRVLGPDDREGETPAERYRRAARAKAQQSAHDAEAVEGTENPGEQEGKGHGGDLLPVLPSVRFDREREQAQLLVEAICRRNARRVGPGGQTTPGFIAVEVDRSDYPSSETELPLAYRKFVEQRLNTGNDDLWDQLNDLEVEWALKQPYRNYKTEPPKEWTEDEVREQLAARQRKGGWS